MRLALLISGTIAGYIFGNIYAAILIAALSHQAAKKLQHLRIPGKSYRTRFIKSTIEIMINLARADGIFLKKELEYIKNFLRYYFNLEGRYFSWYMEYARRITQQKSVNIKKSYANFRKYSQPHEQHFILQCLCELALIDNQVDVYEKRLLFDFADATHIARSEVKRIINKQLQHTPDHYLILGAKPSMALEDIRKKYIELAKFFHPDRFRHRPLQEQEYATEKMKKINHAWQKVLKEKQAATML